MRRNRKENGVSTKINLVGRAVFRAKRKWGGAVAFFIALCRGNKEIIETEKSNRL